MSKAPIPSAKNNTAPSETLQHKLEDIVSKLFAPKREDLQKIMDKLHWEELSSGQLLFREGETGDSLYILVTGRLKAVLHHGTPGEKVVGEIYKGESVGEMALITGEVRTASVSAIRDSTLVKLAKEDFESLVLQSPDLVMNISRIIINRLVSMMHNSQEPDKAFNIALVPTTASVDMPAFTRQLLASFQKVGKACHLNRQMVEDHLNQKVSENNFHLNSWLNDLEVQQNYVIYEGSADDPVWTKRCLRQADKIIFLKDTQSGEELSEIEAEVLVTHRSAYGQKKEIVFLYPEDTEQPKRSHVLLANREVNRHYNIRKNDRQHYDRLARMITNKGIGLVLSGGGARGFAHIGIYQVLREKNIPIDMVCGTSIGGILAAGMAMEWEFSKYFSVCQTAFLQDKPLGDYTLPIVSLIKGHQLQKVNKKHFQDYYIEDLWLNFFCVSSNYSTSEMVVHEKGLVWKAISATASIPGILPPVVEGNHLLIDGCIFNNFPVDLMHTRFGGKIIGIDLKVSKEYQLNYAQVPGGWYMLCSRFLPFLKRYKVPGIAAIMMKSTLLTSDAHQKDIAQFIDLYMNPPVGAFSLLKMEQFHDIVKVGYTYAQEYLQTADLSKLYDLEEELM